MVAPKVLSSAVGQSSWPGDGKADRADARDLGIAESGLRRWMRQADIDDGHVEGRSTDERKELVELRRKNRELEMENENLKRASAYFARENVLLQLGSVWPVSWPPPGSGDGDLPSPEDLHLRLLRVASAKASIRDLDDAHLTVQQSQAPPRP